MTVRAARSPLQSLERQRREHTTHSLALGALTYTADSVMDRRLDVK
ncbi:MAG: hypothetical protein HY718_06360 [Planctomycetes bacterium]|nr:hypothetical protein [Planctomycetota bacterium]